MPQQSLFVRRRAFHCTNRGMWYLDLTADKDTALPHRAAVLHNKTMVQIPIISRKKDVRPDKPTARREKYASLT